MPLSANYDVLVLGQFLFLFMGHIFLPLCMFDKFGLGARNWFYLNECHILSYSSKYSEAVFCKAVSYLEVECPGSCSDVSGPEPCLLGANCALLQQVSLGAVSALHSMWPPVPAEGAVPVYVDWALLLLPFWTVPIPASGCFLPCTWPVLSWILEYSEDPLVTSESLSGQLSPVWNLSSFVSLASPFWLLSSGNQPPCGLPCSWRSLSLAAGAVVGLTSLAPFLSGIAVLCCIVASLLKTIVSYFACFGVVLDEGGLTIAASVLYDRHCRNT